MNRIVNLDGNKIQFSNRPSLSSSADFAMAQFRAKRLDIGSYVNKLVIRDHTKRKVFAEYETDRFVTHAADSPACHGC